MNQPEYTIERWPHGWTLSAPPYAYRGIPIGALAECEALFGKGALMDNGIASCVRRNGHPRVVAAIGKPDELSRWRLSLSEMLKQLPPEEAWWRGLDVGQSSAAIFAVFAQESLAREAREFSQGATPQDTDDFRRCLKLIAAFPEWRPHLGQVAKAYPDGAWPDIISAWDILEEAVAFGGTVNPPLDQFNKRAAMKNPPYRTSIPSGL